MMSFYKESLVDFLNEIEKSRDENKCKLILEQVKKDNDKLKDILKNFLSSNNYFYIKQKIPFNQPVDLYITEPSINDYKNKNLAIRKFNDFNNLYKDCISKIKDKHNSISNLNNAIQDALVALFKFKDLFTIEVEKIDTGFEDEIDDLKSFTCTMFESDIDLHNYYNFLERLSELFIDFNIGDFSVSPDSKIVKYVNIISFTTIINSIIREILLILQSILDNQNYTDVENTVDYITTHDNIDLNLGVESLHYLFSLEDKQVDKLVKKAEKLKEKAENKDKKPSSTNSALAKKSKNSIDEENSLTENDSENGEEENPKASKLRKLKDKISRIPVMTKTFINKTRLFFHNRKSVRLYKRVWGKFEGLWKYYAGDSTIDENRFKGDPVLLLKDTIAPDIIRIGKEVAVLCDEVENIHRKAAASTSKEAVIGMAEKWCKKIPDLTLSGERMDGVNLKKRIVYGTRTRLVNIITKVNNEIYGFNKESMIVKALPPPNLFMISYIVENPQEKPRDQTVPDIFNGPDSFRIMANAEKNDIFQISKLMDAVIKNKLNAETFAKIEDQRKQADARMKNALQDSDNPEEQKEIDKQYKLAMDGLKESVEVMVKQKLYIAELINIFGNLIQRIDKLCIRCINMMLALEAENADKKFRGGLGAGKSLYKTNHTSDLASGKKRQY